jgi:carbon-monoxide dehydrogenase large subunit
MPGSLLGTEVRRVEDPELLTGAGRYVDDLPLEGALHLVFVRSTMAHARLRSVDVDDAAAAPGVVAVYKAGDLELGPTPAFIPINPACERPPLATERVRFVGDPIVAVLATSRAAAVDAAELVIVDYDPLSAAADPEAALEPGATPQFDSLGSNLIAGFRDDPEPDPLAGADVVVRGRFVNQRVAVVPMEGDAIAVEPGAPGPPIALTVHVSTQTAHIFQGIAAYYFGLTPDQLHVIAPYVGGGFGAKSGLMAEHLVAVAAARRLGRPVKWVETRSENLVAMPHGRAQVHYVELGCRRDGTIVGLHTRVVGDAGAYAGFGGALAMGPTRTMATGVYRVPALAYDVAVAVTNTTPVGAFRGAGRPEAAELLERIIDMAADELDIDPVELRLRNLLAPDELPLTTSTGAAYDSGRYAAALEEACRVAGYEKLRQEQADRRASGDRVQLGIGVSTYVEITSGGSTSEFGAVTVNADGSATIRVGTSSHGQGHATSFAMLVADRLGIPLEKVRFVQADTAEVPRGIGTFGSRSLQIGGNAVLQAADEVLEQARQLAADELEAAPGDIVVTDDGRLGVAGVPARALGWDALAQRAEELGKPLASEGDFSQTGPTFPFGAHVSVVEVDLDTGMVRPIRHVAVDDCGRIVNPLLVRGQQHGGVAQGMAQALWEQVVYDDDGNPLTSNLAEYAMPSAAELISIEASNTETPTPLNPLGAKGIGESGTIGAMPAVHNAVIDAVSHLGVRHIDMPCTPERVWRAVRDAEAATLAEPWRDPPAVFATLPLRGDGPQGPSIDP